MIDIDGLMIDDSISAYYYNPMVCTKKFIVLHYTANNGTKATAKGNANYFAGGSREASAHFVVDTGDIAYLCVPETAIAYAVGGTIYPATKGAKYYGICGNGNSISIEMVSCTDENGTYYIPEKTVQNALKLVRYLQSKYNIDNDHVIRHYDVNGKPCPWCWTDVQGYDGEKKWKAFKQSLATNIYVFDNPTPVTPIEEVPDVLYRVQVGAFREKANAETYIKQLNTIKVNGEYLKGYAVEVDGLYKIQVGAFRMRANAEMYRELINANKLNGEYLNSFIVFANKETINTSYCVRITADVLNVRTEPNADSKAVGALIYGGAYTIVAEQDGWGKLKSGLGWIKLSYTQKIAA